MLFCKEETLSQLNVNNMVYYIVGACIMVIGIFINFTVNKRRFNRRGPGGLQHYTSYEASLMTRTIEKLAKLVGYALILIGFGIVVLGYRFSNNGDLGVKNGILYQKDIRSK